MTSEAIQSENSTDTTGDVVARAARYYRMTRYLMFVILLGYGAWSLYDGFVSWPKQEAEFVQSQGKSGVHRSDMDILFNRVLGIALPPLGVLMLVSILYKSRGEIRLSGNTLTAPGHPAVPFDAITALDKRLWDKKGIAYVRYGLPDRGGQITLDDFIYEREPIDKIYKAIEAFVAPADAPTPPGFPVESDQTNNKAHD